MSDVTANPVMPAHAGIQIVERRAAKLRLPGRELWISAFAEMTGCPHAPRLDRPLGNPRWELRPDVRMEMAPQAIEKLRFEFENGWASRASNPQDLGPSPEPLSLPDKLVMKGKGV